MPIVLRMVIDTVTSGYVTKGNIVTSSMGPMLRIAVVVSAACLIRTSVARTIDTAR